MIIGRRKEIVEGGKKDEREAESGDQIL